MQRQRWPLQHQSENDCLSIKLRLKNHPGQVSHCIDKSRYLFNLIYTLKPRSQMNAWLRKVRKANDVRNPLETSWNHFQNISITLNLQFSQGSSPALGITTTQSMDGASPAALDLHWQIVRHWGAMLRSSVEKGESHRRKIFRMKPEHRLHSFSSALVYLWVSESG